MPELVRCKPCGYVTQKARLRRVCPVCGASLKAFEPYEDRVSAQRRRILDLDLHPILVHAPQTFAAFLPLLALCPLVLPGFYADELAVVADFMALILPLTVVGAIGSGLIDGKLKFKKLSTPLIVWKIGVGVSLLVVSAANALTVLLLADQGGGRIAVLVLGVASLVCAVLLGHAGKQLIHPILPGR